MREEWACRGPWRLQGQASERTFGVVVSDELTEHGPQRLLVQDDEVVEALAPERADDPFRNGVRPRRADGRQERFDAEHFGSPTEVSSVAADTITDEVAWLVSPRRGFEQLAPGRRGGRVGGHVEVNRLLPPVGDEEEDAQRLEGERLDREPVCRLDMGSVIGHERPPRPARRARRSPPLIAAVRAVADDNGQLQQVARIRPVPGAGSSATLS